MMEKVENTDVGKEGTDMIFIVKIKVVEPDK